MPLVLFGIPLYALGVLTEVSGSYVIYTAYIVGSLALTKYNRRPLADIGLTGKGLLSSLVSSVALVAAFSVTRFIVVDLRLSPDVTSGAKVIYNLFYWMFGGFGQEIMFRGLILFSLNRWKGWRFALLVSSILFALVHLRAYQSITGILLVGIIGALWGWIALRTRNIVGTSVAHGLFNFLFSFVFVW